MTDQLIGYKPYDARKRGVFYYFVSGLMWILLGGCFVVFVVSYTHFLSQENHQQISQESDDDSDVSGKFVLNQSSSPETDQKSSTLIESSFTQATVSVHAVNHRAGPGTKYPIVGYSLKGDQLVIIAKNSTGTWLRIDPENEIWITASAVILDRDISQIPITKSPP